jgi:hypothetical protein
LLSPHPARLSTRPQAVAREGTFFRAGTFQGMRWQDSFQIDGGRGAGIGTKALVVFVVMLISAASYLHHERSTVQALSDQARERIAAMKQRSGG